MKKVIALAGNPNAGKTTLFNLLTGANQRVGNWPGVTVEHKEGTLRRDKEVTITDLPGIYSLSPYTAEEVVSRDYILDEHPDVIIDIVDGSNLERNLYLTSQLIELGTPVVVAINMMDVVRKNGDRIDVKKLSRELGVPVVEISALKNEGIDELVDVATGAVARPSVHTTFSPEVERALSTIAEKELTGVPEAQRRWYAIKLFERDEKVQAKLGLSEAQRGAVDGTVRAVEDKTDDDAESLITSGRYDHVERVVAACAVRTSQGKMTISDKIDRVITNRVLGLPIFVVVMFLVYYISISTVGTAATDWANDHLFGDGWYAGNFSGEDFEAYSEDKDAYDAATEAITAYEAAAADAGISTDDADWQQAAEAAGVTGTYETFDEDTAEHDYVDVDAAAYQEAVDTVQSFGDDGPDPYAYGPYVPGVPTAIGDLMESLQVPDWLEGVVVDGIVTGICSMLGFLPQMFVLFILLALLEGCGYMARVAFVLDRVFRRFGLSGKSFIPILIGTGCGVPGIMSSRTIENPSDRRMTIMTTTFIPCSAKIPIIALISSAVFGGLWWVAPSAYFLGLAVILCSGIILKKTRPFASETSPFVMELPAYHVPTLGFVARNVWERLWAFIKKAFTILLIATIIIWFTSNYGVENGAFGVVEDQANSILGVIGSAIAWVFAPLGWADWRSTAAVLAGFMAKEQIVGTIGVLYSVGDASWYETFRSSFGLAAGYSFLAFNLLCMPCFAAVSTIVSEMRSACWSWAAIGYQFLTAWVVALWVFQFGGLASGEATFGIWTLIAIALAIVALYLLLRPDPSKRAGRVAAGAVVTEA